MAPDKDTWETGEWLDTPDLTEAIQGIVDEKQTWNPTEASTIMFMIESPMFRNPDGLEGEVSLPKGEAMIQQPDTILQLCLLTQECLACKGEGSSITDYGKGVVAMIVCPICKNGKRSFLLDPDGKLRLRVELAPSKGGIVWSHRDCAKLGHCDIAETMPAFEDCKGRGWTPSQDPWAYVRAGFITISPSQRRRIRNLCYQMWEQGQDPSTAALAVVAEALLKGDV